MDGVNPDTVWTWNAIGKRSGAWNLDKNAPEARKGFLLNHIISDLLPAREGGYRYSNSDPVTGQAAWYDLRVRVEKGRWRGNVRTAVRGNHAAAGPVQGSHENRLAGTQGGQVMTTLPDTTRPGQKKLGLVIDLDTCVGCQACAVSCKEWNTQGYSAPLTDLEPYGPDPAGAWLNRIHGYETGEGRQCARAAFPALLPALRNTGLCDRVPDRGQLQTRRRRHRAGQSRHLHRLQAVFVGLSLRRARV